MKLSKSLLLTIVSVCFCVISVAGKESDESESEDYAEIFTTTTSRIATGKKRTASRTSRPRTQAPRTSTVETGARIDIPEKSTAPLPVDKRCDLDQKCVRYFLCTEEGVVNDDASYLIDERMEGSPKTPANQCASLERCCNNKSIEKKVPFKNEYCGKKEGVMPAECPAKIGKLLNGGGDGSVTPETGGSGSGINGTGGGGTGSYTQNEKTGEAAPTFEGAANTSPPIDSLAQSKCGFSNVYGFGGNENKTSVKSQQGNLTYAQYAEYPWMVAVIKITAVGGGEGLSVFQCGGSLIHPKVVLTTAHNVAEVESNDLKVRAGEYETQTENEMFPHQERNVAQIIRHERFTRANLHNDLAMLVMESEFPLTGVINIACLPPSNTNFVRQKCFTSGWGKNLFGKRGIYQAILKKVELPIINRSVCQAQLRKTRFGQDFELHEGFLCAGGVEGQDACTGDGGSPLVCRTSSDPDHFYLAGVVAGGVGCGNKDVPGLYVDVSKYREWVDEKMHTLKLSTSIYDF